jgi:hypothetical protein
MDSVIIIIIISSSEIARNEWWIYIYTIDQSYENHEKFLNVHISIYMFTPVHFMEQQFGLELCLLSQILKQLLLTVYIRTHPNKMRQYCNSHWRTIIFFTYLRKSE